MIYHCTSITFGGFICYVEIQPAAGCGGLAVLIKKQTGLIVCDEPELTAKSIDMDDSIHSFIHDLVFILFFISSAV